jgi:hypothetical protein
MLEHVSAVRLLLDEIPTNLMKTAHEPYGARAVVYALLLDDRPTVRGDQMRILEAQADPTVVKLVGTTRAAIADRPQLRVPLVDVAVYALRSLSESQYESFRRNVDALIDADQEVDAFEFTLRRLFIRNLDAFFRPVPPPRVRSRAAGEAADEIACVLSTLARAGQPDAESAEVAFRRAATSLGRDLRAELLPSDRCRMDDLGAALDRLASASGPLKRRLVSACLISLVHDGEIHPREALLFRAVSDALDVPVPPILQVVPGAD